MTTPTRITTLTNISQTTVAGDVVTGTTSRALLANEAHIRSVISVIKYPLPTFEVVILPFVIEKIGGQHQIANGLAWYAENRIYLGALHPLDVRGEDNRRLAWETTLLHEIGHLVHYEHLPPPALGTPTGLWATFAGVAHQTDNRSYFNSLEEQFAEWWRWCFGPSTRSIPHRQSLAYKTGIMEWMLSLTGAITMAIGHQSYYVRGQILQRDAAPTIISGRTFLPIRHVAELLGYKVDWLEPETVVIWPKVGDV